MLITLIIFIIISNAVTNDILKSPIYSRITIQGLVLTIYISYNNLFVSTLERGISLYGGLFNSTAISNTFQIFTFFVCIIIVLMTSYYPIKAWSNANLSIKNIVSNIYKFNTKLLNKMSSQYKIIEYPLILLFVITGGIFLTSCSDLIHHSIGCHTQKSIPSVMKTWISDFYPFIFFNNQYDAVVGDVTIVANRSDYVDFTLPYTRSDVKMLVKVRRDPRLNMWNFVQPFSWDLWLSIAIFSTFTGGIIFLMERTVKENSTLRKQLSGVSILWLPVEQTFLPEISAHCLTLGWVEKSSKVPLNTNLR